MEFIISHPDKEKRKEDIISFFVANKTESYISHSEILSGRADTPQKWSNNIAQILSDELDDDGTEIITIEKEATIIGLAILRIVNKNLIIEDLIIDEKLRGFSLGKKMMNYILEIAKQRNIKSLFLESGISNEKAHFFFEGQGFKKLAVSYILQLEN